MNSNITDEKVKIEIKKSPFLPIFINGEGPYKFLLDTGYVSCSVSPEVAQKLQLKRKDVTAREVYISVVEFSIGKAKWRNVIYVDDWSELSNRIGIKMDGLMGYLFLKGLKVEINYPEETIVVKTSKALEETQNLSSQELVESHKREIRDLMEQMSNLSTYQELDGRSEANEKPNNNEIRIRFRNRLPIIPVSINGEGPYQFLLDTGSFGCFVSTELAPKLKLERKRNRILQGSSNEQKYYSCVKILTVGAVQSKDLEVVVKDLSDISNIVASRVDGCLGYSFLKGFSVTINYPEQALVFGKLDIKG